MQTGDSISVRVSHCVTTGKSDVQTVRAVVHSINQYGVVCLDFVKYKSCAYIQDLQNNAVIVV